MSKPIQLPVILGPTASGKTHLAVHLARAIKGDVISADSRQVYKQMDIGTGKDIEEYTIEGEHIPYHLIDICEPGEKYNINLFYKDFLESLSKIESKKSTPILCGGSGLYLQTALEGNELSCIPVDEEFRLQVSGLSKEDLQKLFQEIPVKLQTKLDSSSTKRLIRAIEINNWLKSNPYPSVEKPNLSPILFGIDIPREERRKRITNRLKHRLKNGMIEEVIALQKTVSNEDLKYYGLEYLFITEHLEGQYNQAELFRRLEIAIHQFSKRQMTWFRKMEKDGYKIHWLQHYIPLEEKLDFTISKLKNN